MIKYGNYIGIAGSLASIIGLFFVNNDHRFFRIVGFIFGLVAVAIAVVFELISYRKNKPLKFDRNGNIDYMEKIISTEGNVIVFASDLTWVDNDKIKNTLKNKGNSLSLCVRKTAPCLDEYKKAGINVYTYDQSGIFSPQTRFTIIRSGTTTESISITCILDDSNKQKRYVYELKNKQDFLSQWIMCAANDLFNLTKIINNKS